MLLAESVRAPEPVLEIATLPARMEEIVASEFVVMDPAVPKVSVLLVTVYPATLKVNPPQVMPVPSVTVPAVPSKIAESGVALFQVAVL